MPTTARHLDRGSWKSAISANCSFPGYTDKNKCLAVLDHQFIDAGAGRCSGIANENITRDYKRGCGFWALQYIQIADLQLYSDVNNEQQQVENNSISEINCQVFKSSKRFRISWIYPLHAGMFSGQLQASISFWKYVPA